MATGNSDLKTFAVFVNSKTAIENTPTKSEVSIPFVANIAVHEPFKTFKFSLIDVLFSNVFYNVRPGAQTLKYINTYAAGRGKAASYQLVEVVIPEGFYDYDTLSAYLNQAGILGSVTDSQEAVDPEIFFFSGFGATSTNPLGTSQSPLIDASLSEVAQAKIVLQSPALGNLYQNVGLTDEAMFADQPHSYIYSGLYLVEDQSTYRLLRTLGLSNDSTVPQNIPGTPYAGYGFPIFAQQVGTSPYFKTAYSFDNVNFVQNYTSTVVKQIIPSTITDLSGIDEVYIHCPQFRTQFQSSQYKQPIGPNDVIAVIPVSVPFGTKMQWTPQFPLHAYLINTNISQLDFRMTNSNNELLNFNGVDWSMTLFCEEEIDQSRLEIENGGTFNNPLQMLANASAGSQMQERYNRLKRRSLNR